MLTRLNLCLSDAGCRPTRVHQSGLVMILYYRSHKWSRLKRDETFYGFCFAISDEILHESYINQVITNDRTKADQTHWYYLKILLDIVSMYLTNDWKFTPSIFGTDYVVCRPLLALHFGCPLFGLSWCYSVEEWALLNFINPYPILKSFAESLFCQ